MIVYPPIFYGTELKLAFEGRLTWKVADTLHYNFGSTCKKIVSRVGSLKTYITYLISHQCQTVVHSVKLLISARAATNFRCALDPAAIGGRRLLEVYNQRHFSNSVSPYTRPLLEAAFYWSPGGYQKFYGIFTCYIHYGGTATMLRNKGVAFLVPLVTSRVFICMRFFLQYFGKRFESRGPEIIGTIILLVKQVGNYFL